MAGASEVDAARTPPLLSIVVPTRHRLEMLSACLDTLWPKRQAVDANVYEVIVTDDGTTTSARETVSKFPFARWVEGPRRGPAANRNNGAARASGTWLIFLDDDCIPEPTWLRGYMRAISDAPDLSIFEGRTFADRPQRSLDETAPINEAGGALWSCNLAVRKALFETLGRFDERFPYATLEDVEFRLRIQKAGAATRFVPEAAVCHPWRPVPQNWTPFRQFSESFAVLLKIHPDYLEHYPPGWFLRGSLKALLTVTGPRLLRDRTGFRSLLRRHLGELFMEFEVTKRHVMRTVRKLRPSAVSARG
jgi:GT2 family glycosyltransferase